MQRLVSAMCPQSCSGRGGCYLTESGPTCQCREGFIGEMCEIAVEKAATVITTLGDDSSDFWAIRLVSLLVLFSLLGCCGAIVWYFRSKNGDRVGGLNEISSKAKAAPKKIKEYLENLV